MEPRVLDRRDFLSWGFAFMINDQTFVTEILQTFFNAKNKYGLGCNDLKFL